METTYEEKRHTLEKEANRLRRAYKAAELEANKLLEEAGFKTYFATETAPIKAPIFSASRMPRLGDEDAYSALTAKAKKAETLGYLEALDLTDYFETEEGKAATAAAKAELRTKTRKELNATSNAKQAAKRASAKATRAAERRAAWEAKQQA